MYPTWIFLPYNSTTELELLQYIVREKRSKETVIKSIYLCYKITQNNNIMYSFFDYGSFLNHSARLGRVLFCLYILLYFTIVYNLYFLDDIILFSFLFPSLGQCS